MKSLKNLLIPFIIMVVLLAVAICTIVINSKDSGTVESGTVDSDVVIDIAPNIMSSIEVINRDGTGIGFQGAVDETGSVLWSLLDKYDTDVPLNNDAITTWAYMLGNFMSNGNIGDSSSYNLADYGLDNPQYTVVITQFDGSVSKVYVGNKTADGASCYFMVEGNPDIYTVVLAKYTYCGFQLIDFLATVTLGIEYSNLSTVEFKRDFDGIDLVTACTLYETGDPNYNAISPFEIECSPYYVTLIDKVVNLEITSFVEIPDDQLSEYGLDDPYYEFTFTLNDGRVVTLNLSSSVNGYYYGSSNVVDGYFKVSELQIDGLNTQLMMLLSSYLVYFPATDMSKITGTYGDESFTYDISTTGSISADDATARLNQRDARVFTSEGRSYAAILYESLITISVSDVDTEADPAYEPEVEFTFITNNYQTYVLSFVPRDSNSYYAFLNGEYTTFIVPKSELFNNSGLDTFNYGAWTAYELTVEAIDNSIAGTYDIPVEEGAA